MNILMSGGTGLIGNQLVKRLATEGHHVYVLTRNPKKHKDTEHVSYISYRYSIGKLPYIHSVINLAGESLFGIWTEEKKKRIIESRLQVTEMLTKMLMEMKEKPKTFITGSAVGFYGTNNDIVYTENSNQPNNDFLGDVTNKWESAAKVAEDLGIRTVYARFGVILDRDKGALPQMSLPIKLGIAATIGKGEQWLSWIHINDCINLLYFILQNDHINGPVNITAPQPVRNKRFTTILSHILQRPHLFSIPSFVVDKTIGEMEQLITKGQYVLPKKALENGYEFHYPHLEDALDDIFKK